MSNSPRLQIHLFGHLRFSIDGKPATLKAPPKTAALWAYLLLRRSQPIPRQSLSFTLWPDEPEKVARANLRRHLYHLNRALPTAPADLPWISIDAETVQWNPGVAIWMDVVEFERLSASPDTLAEAVELYSGDLLVDEYDDWIFHERERLRHLFLADLTQLIQGHRTRREYPQAIAYSSRLLAYDPLREDAARQLMALRYESADRAGALREYEVFLARLRAELGVEPMPETVALYEAILRQRGIPNLAYPEGEISPPIHTGPHLALPFVGREHEIGTLKAAWTNAVQGQGRLVMVAGEAGVGKTRLVEEFAHLAESQGGRVLRGRTFALEPTPYQAILGALRAALPMLTALELDPLWLATVAELIPELRNRRARSDSALPDIPQLEPERDRTRLFESLARCLEGLTGPRPVLLILEDLHWAGAATAGLLAYIAYRAPRHRLLILVTYRPEETPRSHPMRETRRRLQSENLLTHLALERLSSQAVAELVEQLSGLSEPPSPLADQLYASSEGNPFFLQELIRDLLEAGQIQMVDGRWHMELGIRPAAPARLRDTLAGRIARLPSQARSLAEVVAVIGPAFNVELARDVSAWSETQVLDALDVLLDNQLVRESDTGGRFEFTFSHHLIQAAIYDRIPAATRTRRHRRVAHVIADLNPDRPDDLAAELGMHFDRGGEPERAASYYLQAARRAQSVYADEEALGALDRGLELATDPSVRFDALAMREEIHHRRGERAAQSVDLDHLEALAQRLTDNERICEVLRRQIRLKRALGERQAEAELIARLKRRAAQLRQPRWQAEALRAEATYQLLLSQYEPARTTLEEALALYQSMNEVNGQVSCLCLLAEIAVHKTQFDRAQAFLQEAQSMITARGDRSLLVKTLRAASGAAFSHRDFPTSMALAEQMLTLCRAIGDREGEADANARLGSILARRSQVQTARQHYEQAAALYAEVGKRQGQAAVLLNTGMLLTNLGRYPEGVDMFRQAETIFASMDDLRGLTHSALNLSANAIYQGDFKLARECAQRSRDLAREIQIPFLEAIALGNLGEAALNLGALDEAIEYLTAALSLRVEHSLPPEESAADLSILIQAYLRAGELQKASQAADRLLDLYADKAETLPYPQQALLAAAQAQRALGAKERAGELLERAHTILQEKSSAIPDADSRTTFLNLPFNRQLLEAYEQDVWPYADNP